jgi:hypothetical protein
MTTNPGLRNQTSVRNTARVIGAVLLLAALVIGVPAVLDLVHAVDNDFEPDPGGGLVLRLAAAGFLLVFAMAALNTGFLGAQARYAAGEVTPVAKDALDHLRGDGPFCRRCGTRNDAEASFCDSCGERLA